MIKDHQVTELYHNYQKLDEIDFKIKKQNAEQIVNLYTPFASEAKLSRLKDCGSMLTFGLYKHTHTGEEKKKLHNAGFCKDKFCPMCNWRRARKYAIQNYQILKALEERQKVRYIFATFTVKNPALVELRESVRHMNKAFLKMMNRKRVKDSVLGFIKAIEFPFQKGSKEFINLHIHCLFAVPARYFDTKYDLYIKQEEWRELWRSALGVDYDPSVDIRIIRPKRDGDDPIASVVAETTKYPMKDVELRHLEKQNDWRTFKILVEQTKGLRLVSYGGVLKKIRADLFGHKDIDEDLVYAVDQELDEKWKLIKYLIYNYENGDYELFSVKEPVEEPVNYEKPKKSIKSVLPTNRRKPDNRPIPIVYLDRFGLIQEVRYDYSRVSDYAIFLRTLRHFDPPENRANISI